MVKIRCKKALALMALLQVLLACSFQVRWSYTTPRYLADTYLSIANKENVTHIILLPII